MRPALRFFEDFAVGLRFRSFAEIALSAERIESFGAETVFGGLVASGWHTAAVAMRLLVDSDLGLGGQGAGVAVESMRFVRPVRPGDSLRVEGTVTETRP